MDLVTLTEEIVKSLAMKKDSVSVKEFPTEEENVMLIQVMVAESDMGRVIGRDGKCANAIRTLVQASSALKENKYVKIDIDKTKYEIADKVALKNAVKLGFLSRRKTLSNNLINGLKISRDRAEEILQEAGIEKTVRGEVLSTRQFISLANAIKKAGF